MTFPLAVSTGTRTLVESGFQLGALRDLAQAPALVAQAALHLSGAEGAVVAVDGLEPSLAGIQTGQATEIAITARGSTLGRITVRHRGRIGPEERAELVLLALQCGTAVDNVRLAVGLGRVLAGQEDERRQVADKLNEELAQDLAAVLLGLRMLPHGATSVDELHAQVVGVLSEVRALAAALRPATLEQIGMTAALDSLALRNGREVVVRVTGEDRIDESLQTTGIASSKASSSRRRRGRGSVCRSPPRNAVSASPCGFRRTSRTTAYATRSRAATMSGGLRIVPTIDDELMRVEIEVPARRDRADRR